MWTRLSWRTSRSGCWHCLRRRALQVRGRHAMAHLGRGPGVRVPPPFSLVGGFLLAWLLQRRLAFDIAAGGPGPAQSIVGAVILIVGLGLMASGLVTFGSNRTAVIPHRPARVLV